MTAARTAADHDQAAAAIATARRVVVTGLVAADADVVMAACNLAEAVGAAVDPGSPETARISGPLVARIGAVTAAVGELHDRADLVVTWFCNPASMAGFLVGCPTATCAGSARRTIAVGPCEPAVGHEQVAVAADAAVDLARVVEAMIRGVALDGAACDARLLAAARELASAIAAADTVAFVTDWRHDTVGLAAWSTASLVRTIAHAKPAFEMPLGERDDAAVAVCTWRYGASGAIGRADRDGGRFLAAEADAVHLIDRHETDCVVVVGTATPEVVAAIERAGVDSAVIRLAADVPTLLRVVDRVRQLRRSAG